MLEAPRRLLLRLATVVAVFALLLAATSALPWAEFKVEGIRQGELYWNHFQVSGFGGPLGMAGKIVAGLGGLGAAMASVVVFTRGRGLWFSAGRWLAYAAGALGLAVYFLSRAFTLSSYEGTVKATGQIVPVLKHENLYGLFTAAACALAGLLVALAGSYVSWRRRPS